MSMTPPGTSKKPSIAGTPGVNPATNPTVPLITPGTTPGSIDLLGSPGAGMSGSPTRQPTPTRAGRGGQGPRKISMRSPDPITLPTVPAQQPTPRPEQEPVTNANPGAGADGLGIVGAGLSQPSSPTIRGGQAGQARTTNPPPARNANIPTTNTSMVTTTATPAAPTHTGILGPTQFAPPYKSIYTLQAPVKPICAEFAHVNCSYLSTPGIAPTLLQLKKHAQSLCILIKYLTVHTLPGMINNAQSELENPATFSDGESYDFLNDLTTAYEGPVNTALARHHNMPLTALMNVLVETSPGAARRHHRHNNNGNTHMTGVDDGDEDESTMDSVLDMCPLYSAHPADLAPNASSLPYATHEALIKHANAVLELLDHEYSARGGLLAILPGEDEKEDRANAETTILGQLILHLQRLVKRTHDLEIQYANAMDAMAGEAVVPTQALSRLGPDGRSPRELVYPQDRFVLVNAGEDVWGFLHAQLAKKETADEQVMQMYLEQGVTGERLWRRAGGEEYARGLTCVDVTTRYYRLRKDPLQTIFVIPAHAAHPGVWATAELERQPTVVSVVKPVWPERASSWEMRHRAQLAELKTLRQAHRAAEQSLQVKTQAEDLLAQDAKLKDATIAALKAEMARLRAYLALPENRRQRDLVEAAAQVTADRAAVASERVALATLKREVEDAQTRLAAERAQLRDEGQRATVAAQTQRSHVHAALARWTEQRQGDDDRAVDAIQRLRDRVEIEIGARLREAELVVRILRDRAPDVYASIGSATASAQQGLAAEREANEVLDGIFGLRATGRVLAG